ncbi:DNA-binding response regulator [Amycolatopsis thailandensis]|uniref:DNA-binding response regulator n=1 Tax=Amycolatopsis thailandensis TaxID=589330 RepID=A0A229RVT7_9PSEU|nr:response regulator transcription factor [Amycolatopsis thailandensis]OXM50793.1 DNA-binding response regulator [Amycolatopsis thailandensis]
MRVVLAEDQFLLREGLARLLDAFGHDVVATTATGPETLDALLRHRPDIGLIDVRMPPDNTDDGLRAALAARKNIPGLPILVLSQHVEQLYARELVADGAGGIGYLLKDRVFDGDEFFDNLERVAAGGTALDPAVITRLLERPGPKSALAALTDREREMLALMAEGLSNAAIARMLHLSKGAVSKYTTTTFDKLGLATDLSANRRVLAVLAYLDDSTRRR